MGALAGLGRRTISGMLSATGQQFSDWSASYRVFSGSRFDPGAMLAVTRSAVTAHLEPQAPFIALMDDTLIKKRGRHVAGTSWRRDPLGPHFSTNLVWANRFLQISAALPEGTGAARAIPIDLTHCPSPRKPRRFAPAAEWEQYRARRKATRISACGADRIASLRSALDRDGQPGRKLLVAVDGGYSNATVFRALPERTGLIGRVRKDARLFGAPSPLEKAGRGRRRCYGEALPTPEALRQDAALPWITVPAFAAGRMFDFAVKEVGPVRWRAAGGRDLRLVIIRPLAYRPRHGARLLYREAAYLLCTDLDVELSELVQAYVWRWEIEVNFRDEKTLLGAGAAQVRTASAVERVPGLICAAYGMLHLAAFESGAVECPRPAWQRPGRKERMSTSMAMRLLRSELWGEALGVVNISDFAYQQKTLAKSEKFLHSPASAILYAAT